MAQKTKLVRIKEITHAKIMQIGFMGESFDDVIQRILKMNKRGESKIKKPSVISDKMDSSLRK